MKKLMTFFCLIFVVTTTMGANMGGRIPMLGQYNQPVEFVSPYSRIPIAPIYIFQNEHEFIVESYLVGEMVEIVRGDSLLYTCIIKKDGKIVIPSDIFGEIELRLVRGNITYYALVVL